MTRGKSQKSGLEPVAKRRTGKKGRQSLRGSVILSEWFDKKGSEWMSPWLLRGPALASTQ